jgi:hypothetical protein
MLAIMMSKVAPCCQRPSKYTYVLQFVTLLTPAVINKQNSMNTS